MPVDLPQRNPRDPEIVDSGVHVRDSERAPATGAQMTGKFGYQVEIALVFFVVRGLLSGRT